MSQKIIAPFSFNAPTSIYFGIGKFRSLSEQITDGCSRILVITGENSFLDTSTYRNFEQTLVNKQVNYDVIKIHKEPSPSDIDQTCSYYGGKHIDRVISIGGGSVIDAGKAISAMLNKNETVKNYLEGIGTKKHNGQKVPFVAIPTTAGTGSEATKNAVITETGELGFKRSLRHDRFVPDIAVVDPELTLTCTPEITAACGMDAFTQLLEAYLSTFSNCITNSLAFGGLEQLLAGLEDAYENGKNLVARSCVSYASLMGGLSLSHAGLGTVHGLAGALGGFFSIPHGVACGTLMAVCNKYTINHLRLSDPNSDFLKKYAKVGRLLTEKKDNDDSYYCDLLLEKIYSMTENFKIPRLSSYGISNQSIEKIVNNTDNKFNPVQLDKDELTKILEERL